ncbi:response regulator [Bradyrhizobium sp. UFLA05-153]
MTTTDGGRSLEGCRVLILEDEYFIADDLSEILKSHGATIVGPLGDLIDAERQVTRDHFDFAIVDVNLRGESTYGIADQLARQGRPFAFATGYGAGAIPERFRDVKRFDKPLDAAIVLAGIRELWRR